MIDPRFGNGLFRHERYRGGLVRPARGQLPGRYAVPGLAGLCQVLRHLPAPGRLRCKPVLAERRGALVVNVERPRVLPE